MSLFYRKIKSTLHENTKYKTKVLLPERKRHAAHCIASTRSAVLSRGGGGNLSGPGWVGTHPVLTWGYPTCSDLGVPWGTRCLGLGYPPGRVIGPETGVPQKGPWTTGIIMRWGTPRKHMGPVEVLWDGDGMPHPECWHTVKTVPSPSFGWER